MLWAFYVFEMAARAVKLYIQLVETNFMVEVGVFGWMEPHSGNGEEKRMSRNEVGEANPNLNPER